MKNKKFLATANRLGEMSYGLVAGQTYKVVEGMYGMLVYDLFDNYITEASRNAFDGYEEIQEVKIPKQPKSFKEELLDYIKSNTETIREVVMDDTECLVEREILDPEKLLAWLNEN